MAAIAGSDEKSGPGPSEKPKDLLPGFEDVLNFSSHCLRSLMLATKASNDLPNAGDDYDYYSSFEGFRDVMGIEGKRLLESIQTVMRYHGVKGNIVRNLDATELEDKFDILVDANDQLLERVGIFLDEAAGLNKRESPLVIAATPKQISGSWNKKTTKQGGVLGNYKLLSAKHIPRPQLKFKDKIDNSNRPFIPKIKEKPNALQPLSESLRMAQTDQSTLTIVEEENLESLMFPNPYKYEIDHFSYPEAIFQDVKPQKWLPLETTPCELVTEREQLEALVNTLCEVKELAVDLENHSYRSFQGITCLMQISTRDHDYILDTLALRSDLHLLNKVFTDPNIIKVFHGADHDMMWLQRDLGLYMVAMFDTGQAARVLSLSRYSLAHLLLNYCDVTADKQFQLADWRIRPLPAQLIKYAREDTHYLLYIYDRLREQLIERGNEQKNLLKAVLQRSTQLCTRAYMKPVFTPDKYLELYQKQRKVLNSQQLHALKALYAWRDQMARQEDESEGYVLPNHMLLQICELLPKESQGVLACCNPIPPLLRQNLPTIHSIIMDAREVSLSRPVLTKPTTPSKPSWKDHPKYKERMTNPLTSPHDLSHQHGMDSDSKIEGSRVSAVAMAPAPSVGAFSWTTKVAPSVRTAVNKAAEIRAAFTSPFEMYLPEKLVTGGRRKPGLANAMWTLKKHTKVTKPKPETDVKPKEDKVKILKKEEEVGKLSFTLNQMVDKEEGLPKKSKKEKAKAMKSGAIQPVATGSSVKVKTEGKAEGKVKAEDNGTQKAKKQKTSAAEPTAETEKPGGEVELAPPEAKKRKKEKLTIESVEAEGFTGHDYTQSDFTIFSEPAAKKGKKGKKKGKKEYNPDATVLKSDFKAASKPRLNPGGQKNVTFGSSGKGEKTSWPKR